MNGYNIALLRLILCLNMLPESERVCPGICTLPAHSTMHADKTNFSIGFEKVPSIPRRPEKRQRSDGAESLKAYFKHWYPEQSRDKTNNSPRSYSRMDTTREDVGLFSSPVEFSRSNTENKLTRSVFSVYHCKCRKHIRKMQPFSSGGNVLHTHSLL